MSMQNHNEEKVVYCEYFGKVCILLVLTTKENPGSIFYACPTPRVVGGHGWMDWVDRAYLQRASSFVHYRGGKFEAFEVMLKEKNDAIEQLELENDRIWEDLGKEIEHTNCLKKYLKVTIILVVCFLFVLVKSELT
ncbi:hypothetical protein LIER_41234 [Lithospermum erythrorhizon]|uniref:GRF-type domain-containing protein n=1 Tax=Lithospermum erythrorhizon TaxID=34254 RepID=A0AAV3R7I3_LITER